MIDRRGVTRVMIQEFLELLNGAVIIHVVEVVEGGIGQRIMSSRSWGRSLGGSVCRRGPGLSRRNFGRQIFGGGGKYREGNNDQAGDEHAQVCVREDASSF